MTGQVRTLAQHRNGGEVEGVAGRGFERANAALAQDDVGIPFGQDVFGARQELVEARGHSALEQDRPVGLADRLEQVEVLHVARADLQDVDFARHPLDLVDAHHFADDRQPAARPASASRAAPSKPRPWNEYGLVRGLNAPPRSMTAPIDLTALRGLDDLFARLDRARAGGDDEFAVADDDVADS